MKKIIPVLLIFSSSIAVSAQTATPVSDDIELIQLSESAFIHVSYVEMEKWGRVGANGLILIDNNEAFLFDTPWTVQQTEDLVSWIKDTMQLDLIGFVPNHWHHDCMGGLSCIRQKGIPSYSGALTAKIAKEEGLPVPDSTFSDSLALTLGSKEIICYYLGPAHSTDNIVVWIPSEEILFAACMVKNMRSGNLGNTSDGDVDAYPETLTKVLEKFPTAKLVIPGHGQYGGLELVKHTIDIANN